jgi:hypothetical protein
MATKIPPASEPPPRYHARLQLPGPEALNPNTVIARLAVMSPELWKEVEAYLLSKGFKPY